MNYNRRIWLQKSLMASTVLMGARGFSHCAPDQNIISSDSGEFLRLNWNENPFGPSDRIIQAVSEAMTSANHYSDDALAEMRSLLGKKFSVNANQIMLTSGSTEILALLGQLAGLEAGEIVSPAKSFPTMLMFGRRAGAKIVEVPLGRGDQFDLDGLLSAITDNTKIVNICNPNNPTSIEVNAQDLADFCRKVPEQTLICVDEAYIEFSKFGSESSLHPLVSEIPNLIVVRTFSKAYGLAGMRLGYAISQSENIQALMRIYPALGMAPGLAPLAAAKAALSDHEFVEKVVENNKVGRKIVCDAFDRWGVKYNPSSTSFIYARDDQFHSDFVQQLGAQNIKITKWSSMSNNIRVSIGKPEWMRTFVNAAEQYLI